MSISKAARAQKPVKRKVVSRTQRVTATVLTDEKAAANPRAHARSTLSPTVGAANTIHTWRRSWRNDQPEDQDQKVRDIIGLAEELGDCNKSILSGDMVRPEAMLSSQAHTLDAIFNVLAARAASNLGHSLETTELYLRLALRAQSQSRATIETLAAVKNPPSIAFVRQANVANGPQQVNNGVSAPATEGSRAPARENLNPPNKLLEQQSGERLDVRTPQAAVEIDRTMAALAEIHGAANHSGKEPRES